MDVNANEAFAILMREVRSPVDCLTEASVDHFESIVLKHLEALQARVRELEELINEISPATWDDERMKYVNVQVSRETYDRIQELKGPHDER